MLKLISHNAKVIKVAVAGMGKMGNYHLSALRRLIAGETESYYKGDVSSLVRRIKICGLCDTNPNNLKNHPEFPHYPSLSELLSREKPDIVIICSPTRTHFELASRSLTAGAHTLVEKPIATSRRDFEALRLLARSHGVRLMSGHVERYNPVAVKISSSLKGNGLAGARYRFTRSQPHPQRIPDDIVVDKAIHDFDLALYFFGPTSQASVLDYKVIDGQIREALIELKHANGVSGTILVSWLVREDQKKRNVRLEFADGALWEGDFLAKTFAVDGRVIPCEVENMCHPVNNQIKDELVDFIAYASEWPPGVNPVLPLLSPEEISESVGLLEAVCAQCRKPAN